jgi:hypothetical protein
MHGNDPSGQEIGRLSMEQWNAQQRPAPQFEQQQLAELPAESAQEPPDVEAMALRLDQMKVEAAIDSERTRAGLNGMFAFALVGGAAFIIQFVMQYGAQSLQKLTDRVALLDVQMLLQAGVVGLVASIIVALLSLFATRRTQHAVHAYQQRLVALGGMPLPERGRRLANQRRASPTDGDVL